MSYSVSYRGSFLKDMKRLSSDQLDQVYDIADDIQANPNLGKKLSGKGGIRSYGFGSRPQYRILYIVYDCEKNKDTCKFNDIEHDKGISMKDCRGLVEFLILRTREEMNNIYNFSKKQLSHLYRL